MTPLLYNVVENQDAQVLIPWSNAVVQNEILVFFKPKHLTISILYLFWASFRTESSQWKISFVRARYQRGRMDNHSNVKERKRKLLFLCKCYQSNNNHDMSAELVC